jgi:thiamine kinase-like enzyme
MSKLKEARDALALVPGWDPNVAEFSELDGGLVNRSFLVCYEGDEYALRIGLPSSAALIGVETSCERTVQKAAAGRGLAPDVVYADGGAGIYLTRYLPGRAWRAGDLDDRKNLETLARLLRDVHALPVCGQTLDLAAAGERYAASIASHQGDEQFAGNCVEVIRTIADGDLVTCCHNDVVAGNIIENERLWLIDWEFAGDNDPLFDLASLVGYHDIDDRRADMLLSAYTGGSEPAARERLAELVRAYDALQWLWFAARQIPHPEDWQSKRLHELRERIR